MKELGVVMVSPGGSDVNKIFNKYIYMKYNKEEIKLFLVEK
jgi:hypothetical protein